MATLIDVINLLKKNKIKEAEVIATELKKDKEIALSLIDMEKGELSKALNNMLKLYYTKGHRDTIARIIAHIFIRRLEFTTAQEFLEKIKEKTFEDYLFLFITNLFLGDAKTAREYLNILREKNPQKAKQLLIETYKIIVLPSKTLTDNEKREILRKITSYFNKEKA